MTIKPAVFLLTAASIFCPAAAVLGQLSAPFEALPSETIFAFRFDNRPETQQRFVESTKLGQLLFSEEKIAEYKHFIERMVDVDEDASGWFAKLREVGLDLDDVYAAMSSEIGGAVVLQSVEGLAAMPTAFVWAEMDEGAAARLFGAVLDSTGQNEALERTDQELAGAPAARIRFLETGDSYLVALLENRFMMAIGLPVEAIATLEDGLAYEEAEWEALGYFIQGQREGGGAFVSEFYSDAGINSIRPSFESRFEILGYVDRVADYLPANLAQMAVLLDLRQFGAAALWSGQDNMEERSVVFLGAERPRSGLASLFDAETFEFRPPSWTPAAISSYSTFALDFSRLLSVAVDTAKKSMPSSLVDQYLASADQQLQQSLNVDLAGLMAAFGKRIHMVEYPIELGPFDPELGIATPRSPQAFVMDFDRPDILSSALGLVTPLASNPESGMQVFDEQGFDGLRLTTPQGTLAVAFGAGKLVLAGGSDAVASQIFSALNTPPAGQDALINDPQLRSFLSRSAPPPGTGFSYSEGDRIFKSMAPIIGMIAKGAGEGLEGDDAELFSEFKNLWPTEEELEGLLGVVFSRVYSNESGLVIEGATEYK